MKVLSGGTEGEPIHPIDRHYHGLKCQLSPLDSEDDTFRYVENIGRQVRLLETSIFDSG